MALRVCNWESVFLPTYPQQLAEHIFLYANQAHMFLDPDKQSYRAVLVPCSYHFYTGVPQVVGLASLLANQKIKKIILVGSYASPIDVDLPLIFPDFDAFASNI